MTDTATVETLTAEVRTLMVGSRQVTLSVARQLDWVALEKLEVFGRVRLGRDTGSAVIGRNSQGALALARYNRPSRPVIDPDDLKGGRIIKCASIRTYPSLGFDALYNDRQIKFETGCLGDCQLGHQYLRAGAEGVCEGWDPNGLEALIDAAIASHDLAQEPHRRADQAPLIVLAGLR